MLSGLTGLRAIAALIVVFYHLNQLLPSTPDGGFILDIHNFVARLSIMVSIFFMLSGFLRALSYLKNQDTPEKIPSFFVALRDRFWRIAPAYYVAIALSVLATWMIHGSEHISVPAILAGLTFTTWFSPDTLFPVLLNGPLWFVSFDMIGWILTSLVMIGYLRIRTLYSSKVIAFYALAVVGITLSLHALWIHLPWQGTDIFPASYWFPLYNPFLFFLHFLFGIGAAYGFHLLQKRNVVAHLKYDGFAVFLILSVCIFLWNIRHTGDDFAYSLIVSPYYFPWIQIAFALLLMVLPYTRYLGKGLDNPFLIFTASISYSLYLIHGVVIATLLAYIFPLPFSFSVWVIFSISTLFLSYIGAYLTDYFIQK